MEYFPRLYENAPKIWTMFRDTMNKYLHIKQIAQSNIWNIFVLVIVFVNTVIVIYYFVVDLELMSQSIQDSINNLDDFFNTVYILDVAMKIIAYGVEAYFDEPWYQFDFFMVMISIMTMIGLQYLQFLKKAKSGKLLKIMKA